MSKKIVAIGGGENNREKADGTRFPYETGPMDIEIIKLTGKEHPNFLFIGHSQPLEIQEGYFRVMQDIYGKMYGCNCKYLKSCELIDKEKVEELVNCADIIYEGGGNTLDMIKLWKSTGFDIVLRKAWKDGKVMCGVSAGANCWFKECSSDSLKILYGNDQPLIGMECLGFVDGFFVPHCDAAGRYESAKELLKGKELTGILCSNCAAVEIIDNQYRIITSDASYHDLQSGYVLKLYWDEKIQTFIEQKMEVCQQFRPLEQLLSKYNGCI